ncbi:hypothetical protein GALMADRAFT_63245 [Galerina marginata CBS 339.88]|uniref:BTB domain-containing protein n=1 Tax=Galerina marginata (strain CBS 339.88) TaxID=685588 RepID=A0A067T8N1_GALM3|nr:hypothetical protein GALMADRAFT_63245 [Galerina marginata CBS 339.88]
MALASDPKYSSAPPNAKRKRTDSEDSGTQINTGPPLRSLQFWFKDRNTILQAQNTQFRIHRGIIARHSKVFSDMLSIPQPEGEALLKGCPVVYLTDAPSDWKNVFSVLYDMNTLQVHRFFAFSFLASMLRLGKKYQLDNLQDSALERIGLQLPDSLFRWDQRSWDYEDIGGGVNNIELINVLIELGIQSLLPMAYYLCLKSCTLAGIFQGFPRPDGTIARLSFETIEIMVLGHERISRAIVDNELSWAINPTAVPTEKCWSREICERHRSQKLERLFPGPDPGIAFVTPKHFANDVYCDECSD